MKTVYILLLGAAFGFFALGCDDSSDKNSNTGEPSDSNGNDDAGDGNGTDPGGEGVVAGSCDLEGLFCMNYECVNNCDAMSEGGAEGCSIAGGVWSDSACTETGAIGICREPDPNGDVVLVYYEDGMLDAASVEEACLQDEGNIFTTP